MRSTIRTISRRLLPLAATLAVFTAACGGEGDDGSTGPTPPPPTGEATVTVVNHAATGSVMFLRYRACGSSGAWSSDVLGASILWGGEQTSFTVSAGCYDVRATPSEVGLDYLYFNGVQLDAGESETLEITAFPAS